MRVLHLDAGREMRGGQWQVLRLIEGLAQAGVESTLLAPAGTPLYTAARDQGCEKGCDRRWRVEPLGLLRALRAARGCDLVHAHDARTHNIGLMISSLKIPGLMISGAPLVVSRRVAFPIRSRWKYRRATRFIAISEYVKSVLVQGGVPAEKISVVYDGVPLLAPGTGAATGVVVLDKGTALASLAAKLAGVPLRPADNLERDVRDAAVLLYLTHSEGLGSGALLAMSAGVPVIASHVGGLPEVIRDGENGILVPNESTAIAAALKRLRDDPELSRRLGQAARQTVMDRFTVDRMVRHTMEVYRQVLS
jgi:hypothetical protein